ncbi:uncharacterized protein LOC133334853 [Musca vetustissima]|uniref:uncharacterized protein LOC133334853 n=1 Tax=Musca vetustissima TaxID=27455 RepID=UPI002AB63F3E|nr:uncharacterized protein LOC133334853 [Musca vetustissima]
MRCFILFSCLAVATVMARPEPPVNYLPPVENNDVAFNSFGNPVPTYSAPPSPDTLAPANNGAVATPEVPVHEDSYNAAYRHSTSSQYQSGYSNAPTETQVHKHIYVHVPPKDFEEEDVMQPVVRHQAAPKQKHYKIVFIKAPSAPVVRPPVVAPPPQNEEKTLIYVLHKKPEAQADIVIPTPAPTKPSKPEVFFIKYKTKKEEAPVYGPPPATRRVSEPAQEYAAPQSAEDSSDFLPMDPSEYEQQTVNAEAPAAEEAEPKYMNIEQGPEAFNEPTMDAFAGEVAQAPESEPSNQYLAPETTSAPIVVAEPEEETEVHTPAPTYGTPNRYFIKRRK